MHEAAIVRSLLDLAFQAATKAGLSNVSSVNVMTGKIHHLVNEVLLLHFDLMKATYNGFERAVLHIEEKDVIIQCYACGQTKELDRPFFICPNCESPDTKLIAGDELHIISIEGSST